MSHTPWSQEDAEKWAMESDVIRKATFEDDAIEGFKAGMAKAAEMIEACETVYWNEVNSKLRIVTKKKSVHDTHEAKLVGVRPIEGSEK